MESEAVGENLATLTRAIWSTQRLTSIADPYVIFLFQVLPRHKKFEGAGKKATTFTRVVWLEQADAAAIKEGEEVTLMDWGNAFVRRIHTDSETGLVSGLEGELHLEGSVKTTKLKLTWLPNIGELVPLSLVDLDHLITKPKVRIGSRNRCISSAPK